MVMVMGPIYKILALLNAITEQKSTTFLQHLLILVVV